MMESKDSFEKMREGKDGDEKVESKGSSLTEEWAKERISFTHSY